MAREPAVQLFCPQETQTRSSDHAQIGSKEARDEIEAYAVIRDLLLSDAEVTTSIESLRHAAIANEFVESCLLPPHSPWQAQYLEPGEAARERERCCAAKMRIAALPQKFSHGINQKSGLLTNE
jgi:hypothetical protein